MANDYWQKRKAKEMYEYMNDAEQVAKDMYNIYGRATMVINKDMDKILDRFQKRFGLTEEQARRIISEAGPNPEDVIRYLRNNTQIIGANEILAEIDAPAYAYRLRHLEEKQAQMDECMRSIRDDEIAKNTAHYKRLADKAYNQSMFDIQKQYGLGFSFAALDKKVIDRLLHSKWSGSNYSTRIWKRTDKLAQALKEELIVSMLTGRTDKRTAEAISQRMQVGAYEARRLVRTESCYVSKEMEMAAYEECDIDTYVFLATLDLRTSEICRKLDMKQFKVSEQKSGVNAPPMHPFCRSTIISGASADSLKEMQRRAYNPETGKTELVPGDMSYEEWQKKYVKGNNETSTEKPKEEKPVTPKIEGNEPVRIEQKEEKVIQEVPQDAVTEVENEIVEQETSSIPEFVPAKTIEEAEEFAKQFVDTSQFGSVGLSYKGIGLELANEINSTLHTFYNTFDVDKLGGIVAPAKNTTLGKQFSAHAGYVPVRNSLIFNRESAKNVDSFISALSNDRQWVDEYLKHPEKFDKSKLSQRVIDVLNAAQESGRATVPQNAKEAINHELGHFMTKFISKEDLKVIEQGMSKYSSKVSGYACENMSEYIAESFASYMKGEGKIDPNLANAFDKLKKTKQPLANGGNIAKVEIPVNKKGNIIDVTEEYLINAKPGVGKIVIEDKTEPYDQNITKWLHNTFGGNITCLQTRSDIGKMPDALWDGIYWEYKKPTTVNAIGDRIAQATRQFSETLNRENRVTDDRGLVIDLSDIKDTEELALRKIIGEINQKFHYKVDVIIVKNGKLLKVWRRKK